MFKTRICGIFGINIPIVQGGMVWNSGYELAAAVSEAGALGLIAAGSLSPAELRDQIRRCREVTSRNFGVNLPVFFRHADEAAQIIVEEKVPVVFTSGGSPARFTNEFKHNGIKVAHVCSTPSQAVKCEKAGVDAVVIEGFEAGGHNGRDELTTMVNVPQTVDAVSIPVIAAGGIADGRGMAAALCLGAEGVQVGSRFVASLEASGHPNFKRAVVEAQACDTFLILRRLMPTRVILNEFAGKALEAEQAGTDIEKLSALLGHGREEAGMACGDLREGELEIGQVAGMIKEIKPAAWIVRQMLSECENVLRRF